MQRSSFAACLLCIGVASALTASDVVTYLGKDSKQLRRTGTIDDYTGQGLTITLATGRQEKIEAEKIVAIQTPAIAEELSGDGLVQEIKIAQAIEAYQQAKRLEPRKWVARRIMAKLVDCYERQDKIDQAGDEFLAIVAVDSETPHFAAIPLAWRAPSTAPLRAKAWLGSKNPAAQLLGASWLVAGSDRSAAINTLKSLSGELDPGIAHLATAQLWRTTLVTASTADVARWQQHVERMPARLRAGPSLVLGDALARLDRADDALLAYLQTPLVYSERKTLASEGYLSASRLLEKMGRAEDACAAAARS